MRNLIPLIAILFITITSNVFAQKTDSLKLKSTEIKGVLLDSETKDPLPYANIVVQRVNRGAITNEVGSFSMDTTGLLESDSISFLYIGYETRHLPLTEFKKMGVVYLEEDIQNLNKVFVFGTPPDPKDIVKKVIENKSKNYKKSTSLSQTFYRVRSTSDIDKMEMKYKKSSISILDKEMIKELENRTPKHSTSYTDLLGNLYYSEEDSDALRYKLDPIKTVSLKEEDLADLKVIESVFEEVFSNTQEEEYWKLKTGIFGFDMDVNEVDTTDADTTPENSSSIISSRRGVTRSLGYSTLSDEDDWDFLYSTGKYNYTLAGGTNVGSEDVYVIDFTPKRGGLYIGRMYVSVETYALIRADYVYDEGKVGSDIQLLGIGYTEDAFSGSILFERVDSTYQLKYCSKKSGQNISIDRSFAIVKKKKRFLLDKKLKEVKIGLEMEFDVNESFEIMVLSQKNIAHTSFNNFNEKKYHKVQYVDQFDDSLWEGFSIIEPTQKMREYKKR